MKRADNQTEGMTAADIGAGRRSRATSLLDMSAAALVEDDGTAPSASDAASAVQTDGLIKLLAEVGTGLWRLRRSMTLSETSPQADEMRRACRHLESVINVLAEGGIRIRDHTGEAVPEGGIYALSAVAYEQTPGLACEQVIETIKPTIYFKEQMIQMGEVIIGTPVKTAD